MIRALFSGFVLVLSFHASATMIEDVKYLETQIVEPETLTAISSWKTYVSKRPAACSEDMQAQGYFQPNAGKKMAVVFHGYSSSTAAMKNVVELFLKEGYNVIVPRLSRHYNKNLRDLDNADYTEWIRDAREALNYAKKFSNKITLAGFSLGGFLAGMLAVEQERNNTSYIDKLVLFAPAWRINPHADLGSVFGNLLGKSLNEHRNTPISCKLGEGFVSGKGSRQVEYIILNTELKYRPDIDGTMFRRINIPHIMFNAPNDEAIDEPWVVGICGERSVCRNFNVVGAEHVTILDDLDKEVKVRSGKRSISDLVSEFIRR